MRIAVAISGGIDSFYALKWGLNNFENLSAVYLNFLNNSTQIRKVKDICSYFKIPLKLFNCENSFKIEIINYFIKEYLLGRTPNPCVLCNKIFKFNYILKRFDKVITGHYAKVVKENDIYFLEKGLDPYKEQSYFLARLDKNILSRIILPLGDKTKKDILNYTESEYKKFGISKESQEICFVENNDYKSFLKKVGNVKEKPGVIKNLEGNIIGKHKGFFNFTVGQRKGLNIAMGVPYYVVKLDAKNNTVYAAPKEKTFNKSFEIKNLLWYMPPETIPELKVKVRYRTTEKLCCINEHRVTLIEKEQAVTPGQLAVFYYKKKVIGSGWIENAD